ncbi:MAG: hypothetical protein RL112_2087 [Planctomycetota bacterium]
MDLDLERRVRFEPDFTRRLGLALASEPPGGRAFGGKGRGRGDGHELEALRAWRDGDDPRRLDWAASARAGEPIAREVRGESSPERVVLVDASLSMAVGRPSKLQLAAELAAFACAQALHAGGRARLVACAQDARELRLHGRQDLPRALAFLESLEARGRLEAAALARWLAEPGEALVLGDWTTIQPAALCPHRPRGGLRALLVLAPEERDPSLALGVLWVDPETGDSRAARVDAAAKDAYIKSLGHELESRSRSFARARSSLVACGSDEPFECVARHMEVA